MRAGQALFLAFLAAAPAAACADEAPACREFAWPLARELAWLSDSKLSSVESGAAVAANGAESVKLRPMADVAFVLPPERSPKNPNSFGAVVRIEQPGKAGVYQITLSQEAWVDVVQRDARLKAVAFSGKQGCAGMRKSVRFDLAAAPFVIQISGSPVDRLNLAVAPAD